MLPPKFGRKQYLRRSRLRKELFDDEHSTMPGERKRCNNTDILNVYVE